MKKTVENHSEGEEFDADEPDEVDEENNAESDKVLIALLLNVTSTKSKQKPAPASKKKPPKPKSEEEDDEEDEDEEDDEEDEEDEDDEDESNDATFLVSKSDLADKDTDPPLWRIDGKALLQKYIPFKDDEGKTLYRNTYTYSGWSINNKNNYYPASIVFKQQSQKEHVVEFQRDLLPKEEENDD
ncbi:unnamed protein product [Bemisia tabaci]|uniref:Uncharacterized protein n=1 Tax=Bemisia tabaci TaxID=7038 RepID=A0A9P0F727_BEMTA|nr:unnamed protein product [Bemisia tabaci]